MRTEPRTEAGKRTVARAPKADMVKVLAYEASDQAKVDTWLSFEREWHTRNAEIAAGIL